MVVKEAATVHLRAKSQGKVCSETSNKIKATQTILAYPTQPRSRAIAFAHALYLANCSETSDRGHSERGQIKPPNKGQAGSTHSIENHL